MFFFSKHIPTLVRAFVVYVQPLLEYVVEPASIVRDTIPSKNPFRNSSLSGYLAWSTGLIITWLIGKHNVDLF